MSCHECSSESYDKAEAWCRETVSAGHGMLFSTELFAAEMTRVSRELGVSVQALNSLFRNAHVTHMKRTSHSVRNQTMRHVKSYLNGTSILKLAKKCNYPPAMMARFIVENVAVLPTRQHPSSTGINTNIKHEQLGGGKNNDAKSTTNNTTKASAGTRKFITQSLRHPEKMLGCASTSILPEYLFSEKVSSNNTDTIPPSLNANDDLIPLSRLSLEVREAVDSDPIYGPRSDKERHNIGIEYELLLEYTLKNMGIPFETEEQLRKRGTAKTPDVLLSCPIGLKVRKKKPPHPIQQSPSRIPGNFEKEDEYEWKIICWIDSKALFGDVDTHTNSVLPQVETYVHRFGPGLVLYWFGHAPLSRLGDSHGDVVVVGGDLPDLFLMPTGEYRGQSGRQLF